MAFKDIIGQEKAVNILLRTIKRERLPSSYLFTGESGIGKKFTAFNLAKVMNCLKTADIHTSEIDSCDECSSCKKIDAGVHPDSICILPEAGQIRIDEIRLIDNFLSFKPFEGKKKVVIIDEADTMNVFAANAFLKTLEEPPKDSMIILISSKPDNLPDTIKSRCSRINFTPLYHEACVEVIQKTIGQKDKEKILEKLPMIVRLSFGRPGLAIAGDPLEDRTWFIKILRGMLHAEKDSWTSREEMEKWFDLLLTLLRDMAIIKVSQDESDLINIDLKNYINKLSSSIDLKGIIKSYQQLNTLKGYFYFNLNKSLTWNYTSSLLRKTLDIRHA
jgi:DNA polymerase-3 subunit delta'